MQIGVVGATGLVGREMVAILRERRVPVARLRLLASARSAGTTVDWRGGRITVEDAATADPRGIDLALFSAGAATARRLAPRFVECGATVIDNSSGFRADPDVPLVVPEVNGDTLTDHRGIIAVPNCSTVQLVVVLKPILDAAGLERVTVATYQSVSGQGQRGIDQLDAELAAGAASGALGSAFAQPIAFESLPHCGPFDERGWSSEELKLMQESRRILDQPDLRIAATAVRVPVRRGHSEAVWVETRREIGVEEARDLLRRAPGVVLVDEPEAGRYPLARRAAGQDAVFVGRLRRDPSVEHGLACWIVSDNIRKGAALNAVQILEELVARGLVEGAGRSRGSGDPDRRLASHGS